MRKPRMDSYLVFIARNTSPSFWMCSRDISPSDLRPSPRLTQSSNQRFLRGSLPERLRVRVASMILVSSDGKLVVLPRGACAAPSAAPRCNVGGSAMPLAEDPVSGAAFGDDNDFSRASTASGFVLSKSPYRKQPHSFHSQ
jgi:hypothetical protein